MIHVVTHCDRNYEAMARCMLASLRRVSTGLHHHLVWCDEQPSSIKDSPINVHQLSELHSWPRLQQIRNTRIGKFWFWSLEPAIVDHFLSLCQDGDMVLYVDADSYFFQDPIPAIEQSLGKNACVALSLHCFPPDKKDRERTCGKFNFGCGAFVACHDSRAVVAEWLDQTMEKCDESKNDQHHLDEWPEKLGSRLAELPRGINVGPWQLMYTPRVGSVVVYNGRVHESWKTGDGSAGCSSPLISYHFHEFRRGFGRNQITLNGEAWNRTNYELHPDTIESVYKAYEKELTVFLK